MRQNGFAATRLLFTPLPEFSETRWPTPPRVRSRVEVLKLRESAPISPFDIQWPDEADFESTSARKTRPQTMTNG
jgi:hypothetical protein